MDDQLVHPAIRTAEQTCIAVPDQWEGELHDGRAFYFRYRFGWATLAVGSSQEQVSGVTRMDQCMGVDVAAKQHGDPLQGCFDSDYERSEVFACLLDPNHRYGAPV